MNEPPECLSVTMTAGGPAGSLLEQVDRLLAQECALPWELVVSIDARATATYEELSKAASSRPRLSVVLAPSVGIPAGRNAAVRSSRGEFVLTCDVDDTVDERWLEQMRQSLLENELVAGRALTLDKGVDPGPFLNEEASLPRFPYGYLPYGLTACLGFTRELYDRLGGFDERMRYADDVDFTWRAQECGTRLAQSDAYVVKHPRAAAADRFRQHYLFGTSDPLLYREHREHGMSRSLGLTAKAYGWLILNCWRLASQERRKQWLGVAGHRLGRLRASLRLRTFYP
jgi:glycosyltransferase involved in cell wall biosynthesis